jgi:HSP20 family protein
MWTNRVLEEMDRLFGPISAGLRSSWSTPNAFPAFNLWEDDDNLHVEAELPGLKQDQIEITVAEGDQLTVAGERQAPTAQGGVWHLQEGGYGRFSRTVTLPAVVDSDKVQAQYESGVLTLTLPKSEKAKPKRISVKSGDAGKTVPAATS